jgi:hypothetical protein
MRSKQVQLKDFTAVSFLKNDYLIWRVIGRPMVPANPETTFQVVRLLPGLEGRGKRS